MARQIGMQGGTHVDPVVLWNNVDDFRRDVSQVSANVASFMFSS